MINEGDLVRIKTYEEMSSKFFMDSDCDFETPAGFHFYQRNIRHCGKEFEVVLVDKVPYDGDVYVFWVNGISHSLTTEMVDIVDEQDDELECVDDFLNGFM